VTGRVRAALAAALAAVLALGGSVVVAPPAAAGRCPVYAAPVDSGRITADGIGEVSGLVRSRSPGVLWFHEDSGNGPWLYATTPSGDLRATIEVLDAWNVDWEDMARGGGRLWLGDIGDNARVRPQIRAYWFDEPSFDVDEVTARSVTLTYEDGPHNAEGMVVDARHDVLIVFEKQRATATSRVYAADLRGVRSGDALELELVARIPIENITAADVGPDGVLVKNNSGGLLFPWVTRRVVRTLRRSAPCPVTLPAGESVAFSTGGGRVYTIPEGSDPPIQYAERA
jgi:hypothetical protein